MKEGTTGSTLGTLYLLKQTSEFSLHANSLIGTNVSILRLVRGPYVCSLCAISTNKQSFRFPVQLAILHISLWLQDRKYLFVL